jgi:ABC-type uncharacterized transport system auxiliary subunit
VIARLKEAAPRAARIALLCALALIAFGGCFFQKPMGTQYYVLDYIPTPPPERLSKGPYPFVLRMRDPSIAEAYRRAQIVYRQSANQMQFYNYHLWAVDPDRMVGDMVLKHLKAARLFDNVTRTVENYVPDYFLSTDVQAIEEYDAKEQWFAHLAIEFQLEDARTNQVVWKKVFDLRKTVAQQEPVYVVRELSYLLENINDRLVKELDVTLDELKHRPPLSQGDGQAPESAPSESGNGKPR